ncbi:hypothetical protein vseg_005892 [Gypsophila vaccaria]
MSPYYDFFFLEKKKEAAKRGQPLPINWTITKELTPDDISDRISLRYGQVWGFIYYHLDNDSRRKLVSQSGLVIDVLDYDDGTQYKLRLTRDDYLKCTMKQGWDTDFVLRRGLIAGDIVGFSWDVPSERLIFGVLRRVIR